MRLARTFLAVTVLGLTQAAGAQTAPAPQDDTSRFERLGDVNAALLYYRHWMIYRSQYEEYSKLLEQVVEPDDMHSEAMHKFLAGNQNLIEAILRAASLKQCDWGVEYNQGYGALLPHAGKMRGDARLLNADAIRLAAEGKMDEAAERTAAIYGLATHMVGDRLLISSLVGAAIMSLGNATVEMLLAAEGLTPAGKDMLLQAFARLDMSDPAALVPAIRSEGEFLSVWVKNRFSGVGGGMRFVREMSSLMNDTVSRRQELLLALSTPEAFEAEVDRAAEAVEQMAQVWRSPDAMAFIQRVNDDVAEGKYGTVARFLVPSLNRAYASDARLRADLDRTIRMVERAPTVQPTEDAAPSR